MCNDVSSRADSAAATAHFLCKESDQLVYYEDYSCDKLLNIDLVTTKDSSIYFCVCVCTTNRHGKEYLVWWFVMDLF